MMLLFCCSVVFRFKAIESTVKYTQNSVLNETNTIIIFCQPSKSMLPQFNSNSYRFDCLCPSRSLVRSLFLFHFVRIFIHLSRFLIANKWLSNEQKPLLKAALTPHKPMGCVYVPMRLLHSYTPSSVVFLLFIRKNGHESHGTHRP